MRKRRKALVILGFETPDQELSSFQKTWNSQRTARGEDPLFRPTTSTEFLLAIDKENKRPGFIEIELHPGETPMAAIRRMTPFSSSAITRPWQPIDTFTYYENDNEWEVQVGLVLVHQNQRQIDLYEQPSELPFLVEWFFPHWLYLQKKKERVNLITSAALDRPAIQKFLAASFEREAA